jgi:hypothetical protein
MGKFLLKIANKLHNMHISFNYFTYVHTLN